MSKIWFCRNCGYEVPSRGRCHACKARLSTSPLPELAAGSDDDEVGYRLQDWTDRSRSRLIVGLIERNILHRFEDEELVVSADDETRTDALVEEITVDGPAEGLLVTDGGPEVAAVDEELAAEVVVLLGAARRLAVDATDMEADGDVAHASATVFVADGPLGVDPESWAAVGRVTRRLLAALGADEALEEEIRRQAAILVKLLAPLVGGGIDGVDEADGIDGAGPGDVAERPGAGRFGEGGDPGDVDADAADAVDGEAVDGEAVDGETVDGETVEAGESVYELPEWLPEQRAELSVYLDEAGVPHSWEGGDLVVPLADEDAVEALFDRVDGVSSDDDDGARYRALEELFAAASRLVNDPDSESKGADLVRAVANADGPTPLGLDDAQWWSIRTRAKALAESIEADAHVDIVFDGATTLRDMLRVLV